MKRLTTKMTLAILASVFWFVVSVYYLVGYMEDDIGWALTVGILPVLIAWGRWWIRRRGKEGKGKKTDKDDDKKELPFLMRKWNVVCFLIFLAVSAFIVISGGSNNHPFTGTFFCEENNKASFAILDPPESFYIKVDNGENFAVSKYKFDMPYKYELKNDRLIIHGLSPVKDVTKLAKMGSATVERSKGGRLKYSMSYDTPFTISKSEYVVDGNEVVGHYDYENSSFMTLFPTVFAFVLLYYLGKVLINIYKRFKQF